MATFGFNAPDYMLRAQAGLPIDPGAGDQPVALPAPAAAPMPNAGPQGAMPPQAEAFKPGLWDILQGYLFNGQSPADAAMAARQRNYQAQQMQMMGQLLRSASPAELKALLTNPGKYGEEYAKNFAPVQTSEGATETMFGGPGAGGSRFVAPKLVFDDKSGIYGTQSAGGYQPVGQNGGDFSLSPTGAEMSGRTGLTGRAVSLPQIVPAGSGPGTFTPTITGPGGNATAPSVPASATASGGVGRGPLVGANGALDPAAFFKSFVLPHEGGWNARDLNGSPTRFGINAAANPDIDLNKLTPDGAATVFATKYFANSGAAHLPPALAAVQADTSFINPKKAAEFLVQSGGDPGKYMDLREAWMKGLEQKFPEAAKYTQAWTNRNNDLRQVAGQLAGGTTPAGQQANPPGWVGGQPRRPSIVPPGDPAYQGLPAGTVLQRAPNGEVSVLQKPEYDPSSKATLRDKAMGEEYKLAKASSAAYQAMLANAGTMTGPSAYAMLDTFARAINPGAVARPTVIETIVKNLGLPAQLIGGLESKFGQGNLPPQVRQQIIDAVVPFAQAHWDQANLMNQANAALAKSHGFDAADVTGPLEARPERVGIQVPAAQQRQAGALYVTPKGPLRWTGTGWVKPQ